MSEIGACDPTPASTVVELHQLRCFVALAEELHFGRAAARMNMTQPPLSRQIQMLEATVGVRLLDRTNRVARLTPAGRAFLNEARSLVEHARTAVTTARLAASGRAGAASIGFTALAALWLVPRLVVAARDSLPGVALILREMLSTDQVQRLLTGQLDLGILRPPVNRPELETAPIHREPLVLALHSSDRLARRKRVALQDLHRHPFVMYSPDDAGPFHALLTSLFQQAAVAPDIVQHIGMPHSILAMVDGGLGAALVPASAQRLALPDVVFRPVAAPAALAPQLVIELHAAWRRANDNPAVPPLLESIRRLGREGVEPPAHRGAR